VYVFDFKKLVVVMTMSVSRSDSNFILLASRASLMQRYRMDMDVKNLLISSTHCPGRFCGTMISVPREDGESVILWLAS
jgi:hypothetical protein